MVKKLLVLALVLISFVGNIANAQCVPQNGEYRNAYGFVENMPRIYDSSRGCYVPQGTAQIPQQVQNVGQQQQWQQQYQGQQSQQIVQQQWQQQQQVQQQQYQQQQYQQVLMNQAVRLQSGQQGSSGCSWTGRAQNVGIAGVLGGLIGVVAGDNSQSARSGAALGMLTGLVVPCDASQQVGQVQQVQQVQQGGGQQVVAQQQQQQQPQQQQQVQQRQAPSCASFPGRVLVIRKNGEYACWLTINEAEEGQIIVKQ